MAVLPDCIVSTFVVFVTIFGGFGSVGIAVTVPLNFFAFWIGYVVVPSRLGLANGVHDVIGIQSIPLKRNSGLLDDVLKCWPVLLIGTGGGTFPKEPTTISCRDDSDSPHILNEFLVNGHSRIVSLIRFAVDEDPVRCGRMERLMLQPIG